MLNQCNYVVLDEADRMIDLGFEPQASGRRRGCARHAALLRFVSTAHAAACAQSCDAIWGPFLSLCAAWPCYALAAQVMGVLDAMPSTNLKPENEGEAGQTISARPARLSPLTPHPPTPNLNTQFTHPAALTRDKPCAGKLASCPAGLLRSRPLAPACPLRMSWQQPSRRPHLRPSCLCFTPADEPLETNRVYRTTYMFSATMPPAVERLAR